jgi:hypothetical protein
VPVVLVYVAAAVASGAFFWLMWRAAGGLAAHGAHIGLALWWWVGASCLLTLLVIARTGAYDVVITLIPWCVALAAASTAQGVRRGLAMAALCVLLASVGLLSYRDHAALELPLMSLALLPALWLSRPWMHAAAPA